MYKKILVPLDGSELAESALSHAEGIARGCTNGEMVLLRVIEKPAWENRPGAYSWGGVVAAEQITKQQQQLEKEAAEYLDRVVGKLKGKGIQVSACVMYGDAAGVILDYAQNNNFDVIVMSTHGRSGISRWALGSVAGKVISISTVPVLIVTPLTGVSSK